MINTVKMSSCVLFYLSLLVTSLHSWGNWASEFKSLLYLTSTKWWHLWKLNPLLSDTKTVSLLFQYMLPPLFPYCLAINIILACISNWPTLLSLGIGKPIKDCCERDLRGQRIDEVMTKIGTFPLHRKTWAF